MFVGWQDIRQVLGLSLLDLQKLPERVGAEIFLTWTLRNVCKDIFSRPTGLFCRLCWNEFASKRFLATTTQTIFKSLSYHALCRCLPFFATTKNICSFWHSNFEWVSTHAFCSWDHVFYAKRNCGSPKCLCKCTESPSRCRTEDLYVGISTCLGATIL